MTENRPEIPDTPEDFPRTADEIRADRDLTRAELGQTVSELADKVDIPARAEAKLHETAEATRQRTAAASHQVAVTAQRAKAQVDRFANQAPSLGEPVRDAGKQVADSVRRHRVPVAVVAAGSAAVVTWFVLRRRRS
ncbi:DUF3618 domain-containing protein [Nocardia bovistercoris]|uniref:DUF3618 domain-containing protein n=1 Tax=Nocardia bovistercoris TaxID=2785916 RepID=A0A931N590_9NOCA|nr:DUF3618 domain-containing protein [Nocardia bovistercoris]MBH0779497.1 DUF3618 domain-containing protein [Nocardia bovistercoris]